MTQTSDATDRFDSWMTSLEARHLADLRFPEVSRALKALSATYVERRSKLSEGAALGGAGKRAAFALFYGPIHYILVREIVRAVGATEGAGTLIDLGCGTGAAGAAWAAASNPPLAVWGTDRDAWALDEAVLTYRHFGLNARTRRGDIARSGIAADLPELQRRQGPLSWLAAFTLNELPDAARDAVLDRLLERAAGGDRVLIVEPLARGIAPWWNRWNARVAAAGGRADEWRFRVPLPPIVQKLDRAAAMDHRELTARSFWIG